jgi:DNA-binding Lrp family transcriptional regulator
VIIVFNLSRESDQEKSNMTTFDSIDKRILIALDDDARLSTVLLAQKAQLARGTVHTRLDRMSQPGALRPHSTRVPLPALGYPLRATVTVEVDQAGFDAAIQALSRIRQVVECVGISGRDDLMCHIVARDADDIYLISQEIQRCPGVSRTATSLVLREFIEYRTAQLIDEESSPTGADRRP